jgi:pimeloyl-ACP methyl ester carboxylesterase
MVEDTIGLLNHLGWTSGVHIAGGSLGGMIAMELAINYPSYVKSLVLACTFADATLPKVCARKYPRVYMINTKPIDRIRKLPSILFVKC